MKNDGRIILSFKRKADATIADRTYREGNFRISSNQSSDPVVPYYFLIATGGGYTEGERYSQEITAGKNTHAVVTTQAPTYIYKCEHDHETTAKNRIVVEENAALELYSDELIPYENARFSGATEVELSDNSTVIITEGITGGWSKDDLPFKYTQISTKLLVKRNQRTVFNDHIILDPVESDMREIGYFDKWTNYNSVTVFDEGIDKAMVERLRKAVERIDYDGKAGMSLLADRGISLKMLSDSGYKNHKLMWAFITAFRENEKGYKAISLRKKNVIGI